jgi:hypothetical protein
MRIVTSLLMASLLSGCAVAAASKYRGVTEATINKCAMRACFIALRDTTIVSSVNNPDGTKTEIYKILRRQGSAGRAVVHGAADIFTLGLWEVVGTPIEGAVNQESFNIVEVVYNADETYKSSRILNAKAPAGAKKDQVSAPAQESASKAL